MRITKHGHSCVRLSVEGRDLVLDPGGFTAPGAAEGAVAILITHEHADHWTAEQLAASDAPIWTIQAVADQIRAADPALAERVTVVRPGEEFEAAGFGVRAVGELHAVIHPEFPRFFNSGYVVTAGGTSLYHPGDSFELPGQEVDVFCAPVCAPWAKMSECLDFARAVAAPRTLAVHDRIYSDLGLGLADQRMADFVGQVGGVYARPADGEDLAPL